MNFYGETELSSTACQKPHTRPGFMFPNSCMLPPVSFLDIVFQEEKSIDDPVSLAPINLALVKSTIGSRP